jgi:hypothetical protein
MLGNCRRHIGRLRILMNIFHKSTHVEKSRQNNSNTNLNFAHTSYNYLHTYCISGFVPTTEIKYNLQKIHHCTRGIHGSCVYEGNFRFNRRGIGLGLYMLSKEIYILCTAHSILVDKRCLCIFGMIFRL